MSSSATAVVQTGPYALEKWTIPIPQMTEESALLRVEACGLCGSDLEYYSGTQVIGASKYPRILGHEVVGTIEQIGPVAAQRKGLKIGDRVALDPILACGSCRRCVMSDNRMFCEGYSFKPAFYGAIPTTEHPALWGGYASHVYVHPDAVMYQVPLTCDPLTATLWNPLAAGIQWAVMYPKTSTGSAVAILGPGQRGLACAIAAKLAGASLIVVTGLGADDHKLKLAREFGADVIVNVEEQDVVELVQDLTNGLGVDVVVDTTSRSTQPVIDAISMIRPGGYLVLYGIKGRSIPDFPIDQAVYKGVTIQAATGLSTDAFRRAIDLVATNRFPFDRLRTHVFGMDEVERAMQVLAGDDPNEQPVNVVLTPTWS